MLGELPALVHGRGQLHGVLAGEERALDDALAVDKGLPGEAVDVHGVAEVRVKEFIDRVNHAELPVTRDHERLYRGVGVQPAFRHTAKMSEIRQQAPSISPALKKKPYQWLISW